MMDPFLFLFITTFASMLFALAALWADKKHGVASSILIALAILPTSIAFLYEVVSLTPTSHLSGWGPFGISLIFVGKIAATLLPPPAVIFALAPEMILLDSARAPTISKLYISKLGSI